METAHYSIIINASKEKVWHTMLDDVTYRLWTKAFHEGSFYEGSWEKGSEMRFIAISADGKAEGMFSKIKDNQPYKFISIEHLGVINNGVVDTTSEQVQKWAHTFENYTFTQTGDQTEVVVDMQIEPDYKAMFDELWPKALMTLKALCEQ